MANRFDTPVEQPLDERIVDSRIQGLDLSGMSKVLEKKKEINKQSYNAFLNAQGVNPNTINRVNADGTFEAVNVGGTDDVYNKQLKQQQDEINSRIDSYKGDWTSEDVMSDIINPASKLALENQSRVKQSQEQLKMIKEGEKGVREAQLSGDRHLMSRVHGYNRMVDEYTGGHRTDIQSMKINDKVDMDKAIRELGKGIGVDGYSKKGVGMGSLGDMVGQMGYERGDKGVTYAKASEVIRSRYNNSEIQHIVKSNIKGQQYELLRRDPSMKGMSPAQISQYTDAYLNNMEDEEFLAQVEKGVASGQLPATNPFTSVPFRNRMEVMEYQEMIRNIAGEERANTFNFHTEGESFSANSELTGRNLSKIEQEQKRMFGRETVRIDSPDNVSLRRTKDGRDLETIVTGKLGINNIAKLEEDMQKQIDIMDREGGFLTGIGIGEKSESYKQASKKREELRLKIQELRGKHVHSTKDEYEPSDINEIVKAVDSNGDPIAPGFEQHALAKGYVTKEKDGTLKVNDEILNSSSGRKQIYDSYVKARKSMESQSVVEYELKREGQMERLTGGIFPGIDPDTKGEDYFKEEKDFEDWRDRMKGTNYKVTVQLKNGATKKMSINEALKEPLVGDAIINFDNVKNFMGQPKVVLGGHLADEDGTNGTAVSFGGGRFMLHRPNIETDEVWATPNKIISDTIGKGQGQGEIKLRDDKGNYQSYVAFGETHDNGSKQYSTVTIGKPATISEEKFEELGLGSNPKVKVVSKGKGKVNIIMSDSKMKDLDIRQFTKLYAKSHLTEITEEDL